jgi:hypothetical protein
MNEPLDMIKLVQELKSRPKARGCIVLTHDYQGQEEWAAELARQTNSEHLDLLETFDRDENLSRGVGEFLVPRLFEFLKGRGKSPVLIVSGVEFLKATWTARPDAARNFAHHAETWSHTPCLLFVMQHDKTLAAHQSSRFRQYRFVIDQKETFALT